MFIAWALLMILMPYFVVKAFHHHTHAPEHSVSCSHSHTGNAPLHSPDDCAICHFFLPLFTEAQAFDFHHELTPISFEQVVYRNERLCTLSYSHHLRAPPIA